MIGSNQPYKLNQNCVHVVFQIHILNKRKVLYRTVRWQMLECVCALLWVFVFFSPSGSCISVEQCEHVVSELQDSMRKAIHLYRMVSDLQQGLCSSDLAFTAHEHWICVLPGLRGTCYCCLVVHLSAPSAWPEEAGGPDFQLLGFPMACYGTLFSLFSLFYALFQRGIRGLVNIYIVFQRYEMS